MRIMKSAPQGLRLATRDVVTKNWLHFCSLSNLIARPRIPLESLQFVLGRTPFCCLHTLHYKFVRLDI